MNKEQLVQFITEQYSADQDHPWTRYPSYTVFRHRGNRKWFALVMDIPKSKLGLPGEETIHVLNIKCDPVLIGSLRAEEGVYPAYHMNKANWITIAIDGGLADDTIKWLLEMSYDLTDTKAKKRTALDSLSNR